MCVIEDEYIKLKMFNVQLTILLNLTFMLLHFS